MRSLLLALALTAGIAAAQQKSVPPHQRATPPATPAPAPHLTDAQIDAAIRIKLAKSKIAADKFTYRVQHGVVTIEGKTDVVQHKGAATRLARTAGAVAVSNHVQISEAARQKAAANLAAGRRRAQVKRGDARSETSSGAAARSSVKPPAATVKKTTSGSGQNP